MTKFMLLLATLLTSAFATATTVRVIGFHPVTCPGEAVKAVRVTDATIADEGANYALDINAQLLECLDKAPAWSSYVPRPEEYVDFYSLGLTTAGERPVHFHIPDYANGEDFTRLHFTVSKAAVAQDPKYFLNVFLFNATVIFTVEIKDGQAVLQQIQ